MSSELVGLIGVIVLLVLLAARMWIGVAMATVGFFGIVYMSGLEQAFNAITQTPFLFISDYNFSIAPMFMLMGNTIAETDIGTALFYTVNKWMGQLRGGLAIAATGASALFSAITGDSMSGIIVFARVALPEMKKFKYSDMLVSGTIAAGATLGPLIPPSMAFVIYGILTEQSIGKLFIAGIIPGVLQAIFYMLTIYIWCRIRPNSGPRGPITSFKEKIVSLQKIWPTITLFLLVIGGIYGGIFTATEGGAVGACGAIIISIINRKMTRNSFFNISMETGLMTAMFVLIMVGAPIFRRFISVSQLPFLLGNFITSLQVPSIVVIIAIVVMYIILGTALPPMMILLLTLPIIYPLVLNLGYDPIWFGVVSVTLIEIGEISPPEGMNVFVLSGLSGISVWRIFRGVIPFLIADFFLIALIIALPELSLFLPNMMK